MIRKTLSCIAAFIAIAFVSMPSFAAKYTGGVPINIDQNVTFNFNIANQGNRTATVWYSNKIAVAIEGANASSYDRAAMEKIVALFEQTKLSFEDFTGLRNLSLNGSYRGLPTIQIPRDNNGAGGLAAHGVFGLSVGKGLFDPFHTRVKAGDISIDQVWLYEMNRNYYKTGSNGWNAWIDWACDNNNSNYGYWTVGFNNAAAFWIVDDLGVGLHYFGRNYDEFRQAHKDELNKYLTNTSYNFTNVWATSKLPWRNGTINTLMSAVLLEWYDALGGKAFIKRLYQEIDNNPRLSNRFDHQTARDNWYRAVSRASGQNTIDYFEQELRWPITQAAKNTIERELGIGGSKVVSVEAEQGKIFGLFNKSADGTYLTSADNNLWYDSPIEDHRVEIDVTVDEPGLYRLSGSVAAIDGAADSFWIKVNDGTKHLWDTEVSSTFKTLDVNSRDVSETVEVNLAAGTHCIKVYVREDGGKLDNIRLTKINDGAAHQKAVSCSGNTGPLARIDVEAEDGRLFGEFKTSSNGAYITSADNDLWYDAEIEEHRVELNVEVPSAGLYQLKGTVSAIDGAADSLWIKVNNGTKHLWDTIVSTTFEEMDVNSRGVSETIELNLAAGSHCIKVYVREDGANLDKISLIHKGNGSQHKAGAKCVDEGTPPIDPPVDPPTLNLLTNGDFELGTVTGWDRAYGGTVSISSDAYEGRHAISSSQRTQWFDGFSQNITSIAKPNIAYSVTAMAKMSSGTDNIDARILYYDANGHHWITLGKVATGTSWAKYSGRFTIKPVGTLSKVELFFFGPQANRSFIVDNIELTE